MLFLADCPESGLIQWAKSIAISKTLGDLGSGSFHSDPVSSKIFRGEKKDWLGSEYQRMGRTGAWDENIGSWMAGNEGHYNNMNEDESVKEL